MQAIRLSDDQCALTGLQHPVFHQGPDQLVNIFACGADEASQLLLANLEVDANTSSCHGPPMFLSELARLLRVDL